MNKWGMGPFKPEAESEPFFTAEERAAFAKTLIPDPLPVPPHWTKTPTPVNKERGKLFADLVLDDNMIVDAQMRRE